MILNKKGNILPDNTLEFIIAILSIVLVIVPGIYFGYKFYTLYANAFPEQAREMIKIITAKTNAVGDGESLRFAMPGLCVDEGRKGECSEGYYIAGWSVEDNKRPERCSLKSCLCVCGPVSGLSSGVLPKSPEIALETRLSDIEKTCQDRRTGFCQMFDEKKLKVSGKVVLVEPKGWKEGLGSETPVDVNYIPLKANLMEFKVEKKDGGIIIGLVE